MVDVGNLAQPPSPSMNPEKASFADQVPQSLRIKLREQVVTQDPDPALLEALAKRNEKPHLKEEEDRNQLSPGLECGGQRGLGGEGASSIGHGSLP